MSETLTVNGKKYEFGLTRAMRQKFINSDNPAIVIELYIKKEDGTYMQWSDFKSCYIGEKVSQFIVNCIKGQRTFYFDGNQKETDVKLLEEKVSYLETVVSMHGLKGARECMYCIHTKFSTGCGQANGAANNCNFKFKARETK